MWLDDLILSFYVADVFEFLFYVAHVFYVVGGSVLLVTYY